MAGVVCVTCTFTEVDFVTDVVAAGFVAVWVSAVPLADLVLLVSSPAALETAPVAAFAALDAALLADPDPQPLSSAVAIPSASAATTIGRRAVNLTVVSPLIAVRVDLGCMVLGVVTHSCFLLLSASPHSSVTTDEADTRGAMVPPSRFVSILPTAPMARTLTSGQPQKQDFRPTSHTRRSSRCRTQGPGNFRGSG